MLRTGLRYASTAPVAKTASTAVTKKRVSQAQLKKERNKLAATSLKDVFSILNPTGSGDDDEVPQNLDLSEIYANTASYTKASFQQQQAILDELKNKYAKMKWNNVPIEAKRMAYFVAYGNYGPREGFPKLEDNIPPPDLPFKMPSFLYSDAPSASTKVSRMPPVNLRAAGEQRRKQYEKETRMDPMSKGVVFVVIALTIMNFRRDRRIQKSNVAPVSEYENFVEEKQREQEIQHRLALAELEELERQRQKAQKKWYFLWLK